MTRAPFEYHIEFCLHNVEEVAEALRGIAQHGASFEQCKIFIFYFTPLSDKPGRRHRITSLTKHALCDWVTLLQNISHHPVPIMH